VRRAVIVDDLGWAPVAMQKEEERERHLNLKEKSAKVALTADREESVVVVAIRPIPACPVAGTGGGTDERHRCEGEGLLWRSLGEKRVM
jgi:hypothetical protein